MNGPITHFEYGKMQHREYEAKASRQWRVVDARNSRKPVLKKTKSLLFFGSLLSAVLAGMLMLLH